MTVVGGLIFGIVAIVPLLFASVRRPVDAAESPATESDVAAARR
jgi:hypothetical protein